MSDAGKRRSWLLVPGSKTREMSHAIECGADVILLDLVDLVADKDKPVARESAKAAIESVAAAGTEAFVQVDARSADEDLPACVWPGLAGIVLARAESPHEVDRAAATLTQLERERGITRESLKIVAALDTARGNHNAYEIARSTPRVAALTLGRADLVMDLRPEPSGEIHLMPYLMQRLVIIAGAAGVTPIGAWWRAPDRGLLATPENTYAAAKRGRAIGFKGAMCLRPNQVEAINRAYS